MFRSKVDIDRHVNEIFRKCSSPEQRSLESLKIANLYLKIKEYDQAKMYAQQFLMVKPNDAAAHELLGLCHEGLNNKVKAFEEFKLTLSLNLNNKNVLKKLALLAVDDDVPLDLIKDKYWIERIEQYLATLPAERFKFKEKLVKMSQGNQSYQKQYEELLHAELDSNPQSLDIHLKILRQYKSPERIVDAYKFASNITASKKIWKQPHVWYREVVDVCKMYEQSGQSLSSKEKTNFYETYVLNVEKEIKFGLHEKGWKLADFSNSLTVFDEVLYKLRASIPNFDQSGGGNGIADKLIVQHYGGQLCFYTLLLVLKKARTDTQGNPALFREKLSSFSPLLLLALNPGLVLEFESKYHGGDSGMADSVEEMKAETHYRLSQCHMFLGLLKKFGTLNDDTIASAFQSKDWLNNILAIVIPAADQQQSSYLKRFLAQQKPSSDLAVLTGNQLCRPEYITGTELSQSCSLHHMVWLGVSLMLEAGTILPPASFCSRHIVPKLQYNARNIHMTHMNLCLLDVDAFLYASVFCAMSGLQYRQGQAGVNDLPLLPADLTPTDLLIGPEQSHWWYHVHSLLISQSEGAMLTAVAKDREILNGVSLVRNVAQHSLHVSLLVSLARMFAARASELGATSGPKDRIRALEARSQHYWECALPPLQRLEKNKNISGVSDTLFRYHGEPITSIEASAIIEEAKCTLGCFLLNNSKLSEASNTFKPLKSAFAKYNLAKIYVKLAEDELHKASAGNSNSPFDTSSSVLNSSLLSALNGEASNSPSGFSYKYSIFLNKAKECLITASARLDAERGAPVYYPNLGDRILDLLTDVETKLETADGTWDERSTQMNSSLNNSTFAAASSSTSHHQPPQPRAGVERCSDYASPVSRQVRNIQHNSSRLYFSPEPSSNVNALYISNQSAVGLASNKALETQVELILERLKRLTEQFERVELNNASGSSQGGNQQEVSRSLNALNDRLDEMTGQLKEMHDKYLNVLEDIKDLVTDKTDVIQNLTENLNTLTSKVNVLMAQEDLDEHYLLNTDDYPEINPSFYSGSSSQVPPPFNPPAAVKPPSGNLKGPYYGGAGTSSSGGLMFSEGQSLPNFYGQQILPPGPSGVLAAPAPIVLPPAGIQHGMPPSALSQLSMMTPPVSAPGAVPVATTVFNVDVKKTPTPQQQPPAPHNVVITTSDRLPTGPPTSTPALSVCIPPQHLLANKPKFGSANPSSTTSSQPAAPTAASASSVGPEESGPRSTAGGVIPGPPNLFGQSAPSGGPVVPAETKGFGFPPTVQPPWLQPTSTPGSAFGFGIPSGNPSVPLFGSASGASLFGGASGTPSFGTSSETPSVGFAVPSGNPTASHFGSSSTSTSATPPTSSSFFGGAPLFGQVPAVNNAFSSPAKPFAVVPSSGGDGTGGLTFGSPAQQSVGFASPAAAGVKGFASPAAALSSGSFLSSPLSAAGPLNSTPVKGSPGSQAGSGPTTPHNFQIQMPGGQDSLNAMKKQLETSPLIRQSFEQAESEDDEVPEHDPMPDFKPIIPLPDEVEVETGEENETVLFERRAKLYRYVGKEWKERGIGAVKILKNKDSGKVRLLMRREVVHKVCANHFLHADMELKPMVNSDKAYIWFAQDYADEVVSEDQLCLRFKTKEDADEFKTVFNEHKAANSGLSPASKPASSSSSGKTDTKQIGFNKELTQVKAGSWECKQCYVMNPGGDKCMACSSVKPGTTTAAAAAAPAPSTTTPSQYKFGGLTFSSTPVLKKEEEKSKGSIESTIDAVVSGNISSTTTGPTPFSSFSFTTLSSNSNLAPGVNPFASHKPAPAPAAVGAAAPGAFSFGTPTAAPVTPSGKDGGAASSFPTLKTLLSTPNAAVGGVDFASLAQSASSTNTGSPFSSSPSNKGFQGAGTPLFEGAGTPLFGGNKFTTTPGQDSKDDVGAGGDDESGGGVAGGNPDDDFVPTAEFKPVIPMPDLVTVITGEENSTTLWECRSKLLRFEVKGKEWKERGLGVMKLLRDETSQAVRLVMRREQVHKVCCNQRISAGFELKPLATSDKAWTWYGVDYSEGETKNELFALRFKTSEQAKEFKAKIEQVVAELKANPSPVKPQAGDMKKSSSTVQVDASKPSLSSLFKPKAGSWECEGCFVRNPQDLTTCPACNTVKPGCTPSQPSTGDEDKATPAAPRFSFGVPKEDNDSSAAPQLAVPQFKPATNVSSSAFSFGIPASSTPAAAGSVSSSTSSFSFGSTPSGDTLGAFVVKPSESIPVSSGVPGGKSSFEFGMNPSEETHQETTEKAPMLFGEVQTENNAFRFGSSKFSFSGLKQPASPGIGNKSGYRTESESEADTTYEEEEDHIHFQPVIPLPDKVEITTGEENETILYQHRAKLYRFAKNEWKERGVGDVKLLRHNETGKLRFIMRREPIEKICLNHYVDSSLHMTPKDDKTWLWGALDFAEGEWAQEQFALRFKTSEIAEEFKSAVDEAVHHSSGDGSSIPKPKRSVSDDDVQIVYEKTPNLTEEEKRLTKKYFLPPLFFEYKNKSPCPGCKGCEDEDESGTEAPVTTSIFTAPAAPFSLSKGPTASRLLAPPKQSSTPNESVSTPTGTSFGSASSPIGKPVEGTPSNDSLSTLDSEKASATMGNIFTTNSLGTDSQTNTPSSLPSGSLFGSAHSSGTGLLFGSANSGKSSAVFGQSSSGSLFGSARDSSGAFGQTSSGGGLFSGASPAGTNLFSTNNTTTSGGNTTLFAGAKKHSPSKFGVNVGDLFSGGGAVAGASEQPAVISGDSAGTAATTKSTGPFGGTTTLFGGSGDKKTSLFGGFTPPSTTVQSAGGSLFGSGSTTGTSVFGSNVATGSFFGPKSSDGMITGAGGLFSGAGATQSIFGAAIQPVFGTKQPPSGVTITELAPTSTVATGDTNSLATNLTSTPPTNAAPGAKGLLTSTPSFLDKVDTAPSFATLASGTSGDIKPFSSGQITWAGAGSSVFTSALPASGNTSTAGQDGEEEGDEGDEGEVGEHDPQFEPIIPLPDIIEVKTGEEDEQKLYEQRCKLYRYDKETKEWKERGVGELKLLYHPEKQTYRLLMRRDQIHKTVVNFLLWPGFELKPLASSDKAWVTTVMNLAEDYPVPESEELAFRFKDCDLANVFKNTLDEAVKQVQQIKANSSQHDTSSVSVTEVAGQDEVEDEDEEEEEYEVVEEEEEEVEDEEELDDDEYANIDFETLEMNMSTLVVELPVTLLKRTNNKSQWTSIGKGTGKIEQDEQTAIYRVSVVDQSEEITLDTPLTEDTTLESKGKAIVWRGTDLSAGYPDNQDFMLKFESDEHVESFLQSMYEGVTMAKEASELNVED